MNGRLPARRRSPSPRHLTGRGAHDVRTGGQWTRRQSVKNFAIRAAIRAAFFFADRVPRAVLVAVCRTVGRAAHALFGDLRRAARGAASKAFDTETAKSVARECFERAGENLGVSLLLRRSPVHASTFVRLSAHAEATLSRALAKGNGVVFVTAHLGPFEHIAARIAELGHPSAIVVRESYDPGLDACVDAHRKARGLEVIHRGAAGAPFRIARALRRGLAVGFLPDLPGRGVASVDVPFLGGRAPFPRGPQEIAHRFGAPVVLGLLRRDPSSRRPRFDLDVVDLEHMPETADVEELTHRVAAALERAILNTPADWLWMASRGQTRKPPPPSEMRKASRETSGRSAGEAPGELRTQA
jgi:KDO2-lipid IV(A) lauroyltransferase